MAFGHVGWHHTKAKAARARDQEKWRPVFRPIAPNQYLEQILIAKVCNFGGICFKSGFA
jgi:hypothetical protein